MEQETSSSSSNSSSSRKRDREAEEGPEVESKRLCKQNQELQSILEEAENLDECQQGLVSDVMRSLEEELGVSTSSSDTPQAAAPAASVSEDSSCQEISRPAGAHLDIGYLLEASDDELGISPAEQPALVEAEDLLRAESCESWGSSGDEWGGDDFSGEACFMDEIGGQEWLRRTLEMFLSSRTAAAPSAAVTALGLGQGFEPVTAQAGLIL